MLYEVITKLTKCFNDFVANMAQLAEDSNSAHYNRLELNSKKIGIITAGTPYYYAKEVFVITSYSIHYTKLYEMQLQLSVC